MRYTIRYGDTLSDLATRYNTSVNSIVTLNAIADPDKIRAGDIIELPVDQPRWVTKLRDILFGRKPWWQK